MAYALVRATSRLFSTPAFATSSRRTQAKGLLYKNHRDDVEQALPPAIARLQAEGLRGKQGQVVAHALVRAKSRLFSTPAFAHASRGIETSLDTARMSAYATLGQRAQANSPLYNARTSLS